MSRYLVLSTIRGVTDAGGSPMGYRKGAIVELTSSQVSALGASNFRLAASPGTPQTVTYQGGGSSYSAVQTGGQNHDLASEAAGASN
jgi:hypothetical protein